MRSSLVDSFTPCNQCDRWWWIGDARFTAIFRFQPQNTRTPPWTILVWNVFDCIEMFENALKFVNVALIFRMQTLPIMTKEYTFSQFPSTTINGKHLPAVKAVQEDCQWPFKKSVGIRTDTWTTNALQFIHHSVQIGGESSYLYLDQLIM